MNDTDAGSSALESTLDRLNERLDHIEDHLVRLGNVVGYHYGRFDPDLAPDGEGLPADVRQLAQAGKTLEAIKRYRELTGSSLDQARDAIQGAG